MANGREQQNQGGIQLPQVNYLLVPQDDYVYEARPLPETELEKGATPTQQGGMATQFDAVSSGIDNNV